MDYKVNVGRGRAIEVKETILDKAIRYVNPVAAARRVNARLSLQAVSNTQGGYKGGSKSRRALSGYTADVGSADAVLLPDLPELRNRSRDLVRNEPLAGGAINTVCTSVVGTGLALQSQINASVLRMTDDQAAEWQSKAELEFELWCNSPNCDASRTQNFYELQDLILRSTLESGDVFSLTPYIETPGFPYQLKLHIVEADRVANPAGQSDNNQIAGGVKCDSYGAPTEYHVLNEHPGNLRRTDRQGVWVKAFGERSQRRQVLHIFKRVRPGQTRGEPFLAPVIELIKQIGRYTDAEIMAAVLSSFIAIKTTTPDGTGLSNPLDSAIDGKTPGANGDTARGSWNGELSSGLVVDLATGEDIADHAPSRPNSGFDPFIMSLLRQIGVRLELPFEVLIKHFTASYSAARGALLEAWRFYKVRRSWLAGKFCQPVYELFLEEAILRGRIAAPGFFSDPLMRMAYCGATWNGDGPGALDPTKEASAAEKRMNIGLTSLKQEKAEYDGGDWEQTHKQLAKERKMRRDDRLDEPQAGQTVANDSEKPQLPTDDAQADRVDRVSDALINKLMEPAHDAVTHKAVLNLAENLSHMAETMRSQPSPVINITVPEREVHLHAPRSGNKVTVAERDKTTGLIQRTITREDDDE